MPESNVADTALPQVPLVCVWVKATIPFETSLKFPLAVQLPGEEQDTETKTDLGALVLSIPLLNVAITALDQVPFVCVWVNPSTTFALFVR